MKKGFTLIELLVVIAVIGMLASIALVSFKGTREKASLAKAEQFASSIHHVLGAFAVGIWTFDEGIQGSALDTSGYGNNGTVNGAILAPDRKGQTKAYSFDGTDDDITISRIDFSASGGTVSIWFNLDTAITGRIPLNDSHDNSAYIGVYPAGIIRLRTVTALSVDFNVPAISFNTWYHLVVTRSDNKARVYLNSIESASGEQSFPGPFQIDQIGRYALGQYPQANWDGAIDDVRIYNQALTVGEIQQMYAESMPKYQVVLKTQEFAE